MKLYKLNDIIKADPEADSRQVQEQIRAVMSILGTRGGSVKGKCKSRGDSGYYSKMRKMRKG